MSDLVRFGVALDEKTLKQFDSLIRSQKYTNRSEAIRDLMRAEFARQTHQDENFDVVCIISFVYNHHRRELINKLLEVQHDSKAKVTCAQHVHLTHDSCLEVIITQGKIKEVQNLSNEIKSAKGVLFSGLTVVSRLKDLV